MADGTRRGEMPRLTWQDGVPGYRFGSLFIPRIAGGEDDPKPGEGDPPKGDDAKDDGDDFDKERALATIRKLREKERAGVATQKQLDDALARLKAIEDKDKSETERLAGQAQDASEKLAAAERRAADLALRLTVERTATKLGFHDPDDAFRLLDRKAVAMDDDGDPTNVETLLKDLAKAKPHLVKADGADKKADRGTPTTPKPNGKALSPEELVEEHTKRLQSTGLFSRL